MSFSVIAPQRGDKNAPPDSEAFATYWYNQMLSVTGSLTIQPNLLAAIYEEGCQTQAWRRLKKKDGTHFQTFDEFCETKKPWGLETSPAYIRSLIALAEGKAVAAAITAPELKAHGDRGPDAEPRMAKQSADNSECFNDTKRGYNVTSFSGDVIGDAVTQTTFDVQQRRRGNSAEYRAGRLKRDAPEVAARLARGEFPSVSAAFREAGLERKPDPVRFIVRQVEKLDPARRYEAVIGAVGHLSKADVSRLYEQLRAYVEDGEALL